MDFGSKDIYIFFPFPLFVSVYVYASVCDFACIALLLPFVLGFCPSVFVFVFLLFKICFLIIIFYFNNFILFYFTLFYFILLYLLSSSLPPSLSLSFFLSIFSPFYSEPCG